MKTREIMKDEKLVKTVIFKTLVNFYHKMSFVNNYIFAFIYSGIVYMVNIDSSQWAGVKLDKASRGAGYSIRFKPNKAEKIQLISYGAEVLCSEEYFNELVKSSKYNKGEIIEKLITEYHGQEWEKDNIPFTDDGDLTVDGIAYQIKFEKATFINEKQMMKMKAEGK